MLDHVILAVSDVARSVDFYTATLAPLGITIRADYHGTDGPPGHPDLNGRPSRALPSVSLRPSGV